MPNVPGPPSPPKCITVLATQDVKILDGNSQEILMEPTGITVKALQINMQKPDGAGADGDVTINADNAVINCATKAVVNTPAMHLGGEGGLAVARVGDDVNLTTGKIISGSSIVSATG